MNRCFCLLIVLLNASCPQMTARTISQGDASLLSPAEYLQAAQNTISGIESGAIPTEPGDHAKALSILADALARVGRYSDAEETLNKAEGETIELPSALRTEVMTKIHLGHANIEALKGEIGQATQELKELLASADIARQLVPLVRNRLLAILYQAREFTTMENLLGVWRASPGGSSDRLLLTMTYNVQVALKKWVDAQKTARDIQALSRNESEDVAALLLLAFANSNDGKFDDAEKELQQADELLLTLDSNAPVTVALKRLWSQAALKNALNARKLDRVEAIYKEKGDPGDPQGWWLLCVAETDLGKLAEATIAGKNCLRLLGSTPATAIGFAALAHYLVSFLYLRQENTAEARFELEQGLKWEMQNENQLVSSVIDDSIYFRDAVTRADPVSLAASLGEASLVEQALFVTEGFVYGTLQRKSAYLNQGLRGAKRLRGGECILAMFEYNDLSIGSPVSSSPRRLAGAIILKKGTPSSFTPLGPVKPIADMVKQFYNSLGIESAQSEDSMIDALSSLYGFIVPLLMKDNLLAPTVLCFGDGVFAYLPFHLLWHESKFLIAERDVAYLPFFRALERSGRKYSSNPSIIVGNAIYSAEDALPSASRECEAVASSLASSQIEVGDILEQEKANARNFLDIKSPAFLHVVAHGSAKYVSEKEWADPRDRLRQQLNSSCLILSKSETGNGRWGNEKYDLITGENIIDCDLSGTRCVFLHACDSGAGTSASREGKIGLLTALLSCGPHRAVLSPWNIIDDFAPNLASSAYQKAVVHFDGERDVKLFSEFQRSSLSEMQENQSVWKAVRTSGALFLYLGCR
jgi:tetratricopeptide (TPR) repeat protein